ncbi:MAG: endonuclease III [Clostridia bacterium]|nr:endonuclease III [Clostridia bacterium]
MTKKQLVLEIKKLLDIQYPEAECTLDYKDPLQLLIATQLAAQCTDARVNIVTPSLFAKYPDAKAFANADIKELESYIYSTGFYHNKAKNIIECCKKILSDFGGKVPETMEELTSLAGVGRKTANIIIGDIHHNPAVVVDTHCKRIAKRLGLTKNTDPTKVEFDLIKILPPDYTYIFCHQIVLHGRKYCKSQNPDCANCPLKEICKKVGVKEK